MTTRRGFLGGLAGILAAGFAPAAIGSQVLMPVRQIITPPLFDNWAHSSRLIKGDNLTIEGLLDADGKPTRFVVTEAMSSSEAAVRAIHHGTRNWSKHINLVYA